MHPPRQKKRPPLASGLSPALECVIERDGKERAPREEAQEQDREIEEDGPVVSFHRTQESPDRMGLRAGGIGIAMDEEHGGIPGGGEQHEERHAGKGNPLLPIVLPPPRPGEVERRRDEGHGKSDRSLRQRGEGHADIEDPDPSAYAAFTVQPQPESVQRSRGEKNQDAVGQRHAPESEDFQVQQEHQAAEERNGSVSLVRKKQVVEEDQPHAEEGGGEPCGELVDAEQAIGPIHQPVEKDRFGHAQFTVERRREAVSRFEHFPPCFGVPSLVTVGQPHVAEPQEKQQSRESQQGKQVTCDE